MRASIKLKRALSLLLTFAMLIPGAGFGLMTRTQAADETTQTVTDAQLIGENYTALTDAERALLSSGLLKSEPHSFVPPTAETAKVTVNKDNKTVTAPDYTDGKGNTWKPVSATLTANENGATTTYTLTQSGNTFSYTYTGNSFYVEVKYALNINVNPLYKQAPLLAVPSQLKTGIENGVTNLDKLVEVRDKLSLLEEEQAKVKMEQLRDGTYDAELKFGETAAAAMNALYTQWGKDGNGKKFDLTVELNAYQKGKTAFLLENSGSAFKTTLSDTITKVQAIVGDGVWGTIDETYGKLYKNDGSLTESGQTAQKFSPDKLEAAKDAKGAKDLVLDTLNSWLTTANSVLNDANGWSVAGKASDLLVENPDYTKLETLIAAITTLTDVEADDFAMINPLHAADATVKVNMDMFNVAVTVKWMVAGAEVDSDALTQKGESYTETVTLVKDTTRKDIQDALAAVEKAAKVSWEGFDYDHYEATCSDLPDTLTEDIDCTITYNPVTFQVTRWGETPVDLPYGYRLKLPGHTDTEKSYDYTVNGQPYAENEVYTITGETSITRTEGAAYTITDFYTVVAHSHNMNDRDEDILTSGAIKDNSTIRYRLPKGELVTLSGDNTLTAKTCQSAYQDLSWVPYSYDVVQEGGTKTTHFFSGSPYTATITESDVARVDVNYRLTLTNFADDRVAAAVALPEKLSGEAANQKQALSSLSGVQSSLKILNSATIGTLLGEGGLIAKKTLNENTEKNTALKTLFTNVLTDMKRDCLDDNGDLVLYNLITEYDKQGFVYYYKNLADFYHQVDALSGHLERLLAEDTSLTAEDKTDALTVLLEAVGQGDKAGSIDTLRGKMTEIKDKLADPADLTSATSRIDTTDTAALTKLVNALNGAGTSGTYTATKPYLTAPAFSKTPTSYVTLTINVVVDGGDPVPVSKSFKKNGAGATVSKSEMDALKAEAEEKVNAALGDRKAYYTGAYSGDLTEGTFTVNQVVDYIWNAKTYTVTFDGTDMAPQTITVKNPVITLPKATGTGQRYEYTIAGETVTAESYTFTTAQLDSLFGTAGTYTVTRKSVDTANEKLENAITAMNPGGALKLKLEDGKVIMSIDASNAGTLSGDLEKFANGLAQSGYTYIGLGGKAFYSDSKVSLQTLLDAILGDDTFGSAKITTNITESGTVAESKMLSSKIQFGSKAENATAVVEKDLDLEIHLTGVSDRMVTVRNGLYKAKSNVSFQFKNGKLALDFKLPEKIYEVYLAALLMTGNVKLDEVNTLNQEVAYQFAADLVESACGEGVNATTYVNTIKKLDQDGNSVTAAIEEYEKYINYVLDYLGLGGEQSVLAVDKNGYTIHMTAEAKQINKTLGKVITDTSKLDLVTGLIVECGTGGQVAMDITVGVKNIDDPGAFQALIFNESALSGTTVAEKANVVDFTTNLADSLTTAKKLCGVILLDDLEQNLTFRSTTYLDLNGHTVTGNITVADGGKLTIIDSSIDTVKCGGVTGSITGSCVIVGGKYTADVSGFVKQGYGQNKDGVVVNDFYTVAEDENGNITVCLNADILSSNTKFTAQTAKALALDLCGDVILNYYPTASVEIGGTGESAGESMGIFAIPAVGLLDLYLSENTAKDVVGTLVDAVNAKGIKDFVNDLIEDFTAFTKISESVKDNKPFASYTITTAPWKVALVQKEDNSLDLEVGANPEKTSTVTLSLTVGGSDTYKAELQDLTAGLGAIVKSDIAFDSASGKYENKTATGTVSGHANVTIDMTGDPNYAVVVGYIMAYGGHKGVEGVDKEAFVNAIKAYYDDHSTAALKTAWDAVTISQALDALKKINGSDTVPNMANALGLTETYVKEDAVKLEKQFHRLLDALGWALDQLNIADFSITQTTTMGDLEKNAKATGEYLVDRTNDTRTPSVTAGGYTFKCSLNLKSGSLRLKLFADGVTVSGKVASYNPKHETKIQLKDPTTGDVKHETKIEALTEGSGKVEQTFTLTGVAPGTYNLVVTKDCHLTYTIEGVVVGATGLDLTADSRENIKLITLLAGDVNGDGVIEINDLNLVWNDANYGKSFANADNKLTDVNGDGVVEINDLNLVWNDANYGKSAERDCTVKYEEEDV